MWIPTWDFKLSLRENCVPQVSHLYCLFCVNMDMLLKIKNFVTIVHHRYHICMVYSLCGYGHRISKYHFVRIVHHIYHICMVYTLYGYGHVSSNYFLVRIVHHTYHIYMVYPLCGYRHGISNDHFVRIVHHKYHICMVIPCMDTDMSLQTTTV